VIRLRASQNTRLSELVPVLVFHVVGALIWFFALGFSADIGSDHQFNESVLIGAASWLVAALFIVWLWRSGRSNRITLWIPVVWWVLSFLFVIYVVY
jgi:hypothetical protein